MASCDDDFSILSDDSHHQSNPNHLHHQHILHQAYSSHRFPVKSDPIHAPSEQILPLIPAGSGTGPDDIAVDEAEEQLEEGDNETNSAFHAVNPFTDNSNPFNNEASARTEKRRDSEEHSDGANSNHYSYKRPRASGSVGNAGEYRKDREEWSDAAIECLLDAYTDKFTQLNRGNLRGRDWEEVAAIVSERSQKQTKTVEQCKNKVDNLKKRYRLERHRMSNGGLSASHWPWFKKMEEIVGNSLPVKVAAEENKGVRVSSTPAAKQLKRYATTIATASPVTQMNNTKAKSLCNTRWRRVVLKISSVALAGTDSNNVDPKVMMLIAREVAIACRLGVEIAVVVGGRNFFCGDTWVAETGSDRHSAYQIGMMANMMNAVLLQSSLEKVGVQARVQTTLGMNSVAEPYNRRKAIRHLEKGRVVIFGGLGAGIGNPLFATDTAAALQASEINAEAVLKGTNVDGVYDCHSRDNNVTFEHISFRDLATRGAGSMDMMALTCCQENDIPVVVFNLLEPGNISKALCGEQVGTLIDQTGSIS